MSAERIERLEDQISLITRLLDPDRDRWAFFALEHGLTPGQRKGIADEMESAYRALQRNEPLDFIAFEQRLQPYIPENEQHAAHHFIQGLLITFDHTRQWSDVVEHYRRDFNGPRLT